MRAMYYAQIWLLTTISQKEFWPQLEKYGIYLPGGLGDNFRQVKAWKDVSVLLLYLRQDDSHAMHSIRWSSSSDLGKTTSLHHSSAPFSMARKMATSIVRSQILRLQKNA